MLIVDGWLRLDSAAWRNKIIYAKESLVIYPICSLQIISANYGPVNYGLPLLRLCIRETPSLPRRNYLCWRISNFIPTSRDMLIPVSVYPILHRVGAFVPVFEGLHSMHPVSPWILTVGDGLKHLGGRIRQLMLAVPVGILHAFCR